MYLAFLFIAANILHNTKNWRIIIHFNAYITKNYFIFAC